MSAEVSNLKLALPRWLLIILIGRRPQWTFVRVVVLAIVCFFVFSYVLLPVKVDGLSMLPTYRSGHVGFVNRLAYMSHEPELGDVVSIRFSGTSVMLMKRIIGMPGETVAFVQGKLLINGQVREEPYVKSWCRWDMPPRQLGPREYFVVGDNRQMPIEEHEHGVATRDRIIGKILL